MLEKDAVNVLSESAYGTHSLVIYSTLGVLRDFYTLYIPKQIQDKNEVIQFLPFYETENSVRTILSESDTALNVDKAENKDKTLILRDSLETYHNQTTPQSIRDANLDLVKHATTTKLKEFQLWMIGDLFSSKNKFRTF